MRNYTSFWLGLGVFFALVFVGGIFFFNPHTAVAPTQTATTTSTGTTTVTNLGGGVSLITKGGSVTVTPIDDSIPAPDLNRVVIYSSTLAPDFLAALQHNIALQVAKLKSGSAQGAGWLQLAIYYKMAGDYTAAEQVWIYLTKTSPNSFIAYADLGDLYQNFKKDYPKAEVNYLVAVKLNPSDVDLYRSLYTLYRYQYKTGTSAAADIVAQGLKANPDNPTLLQLQAELQKSSQ